MQEHNKLLEMIHRLERRIEIVDKKSQEKSLEQMSFHSNFGRKLSQERSPRATGKPPVSPPPARADL